MKEQTKNVVNDKKKTAIAYSKGYTLLRFWESDINENPVYILETLIENLL
jgi:very-short-patch-repair endonuclease